LAPQSNWQVNKAAFPANNKREQESEDLVNDHSLNSDDYATSISNRCAASGPDIGHFFHFQLSPSPTQFIENAKAISQRNLTE